MLLASSKSPMHVSRDPGKGRTRYIRVNLMQAVPGFF
jgi:hypothetical protein